MAYKGPVADRIMAAVEFDPFGGCWLWTGSLNRGGYGRIWTGEDQHVVHRLAKQVIGNVDLAGSLALHKCDVRCCVNPDHIYAGTHQQNTDDMVLRGRQRPSRGSSNPISKLTEEDAAAIFLSHEKRSTLSARYGVNKSVIAKIKTGASWTHVTKGLRNGS